MFDTYCCPPPLYLNIFAPQELRRNTENKQKTYFFFQIKVQSFIIYFWVASELQCKYYLVLVRLCLGD